MPRLAPKGDAGTPGRIVRRRIKITVEKRDEVELHPAKISQIKIGWHERMRQIHHELRPPPRALGKQHRPRRAAIGNSARIDGASWTSHGRGWPLQTPR